MLKFLALGSVLLTTMVSAQNMGMPGAGPNPLMPGMPTQPLDGGSLLESHSKWTKIRKKLFSMMRVISVLSNLIKFRNTLTTPFLPTSPYDHYSIQPTPGAAGAVGGAMGMGGGMGTSGAMGMGGAMGGGMSAMG